MSILNVGLQTAAVELADVDAPQLGADPRIDWYVLLAGGIGGLLSWMLPKIAGWEELPGTRSAWAIPMLIPVGMVAGYLGVFLVAKTDTRSTRHCLCFAVLCGLCWKPVYEMGMQLITKKDALQKSQQEIRDKDKSITGLKHDIVVKQAQADSSQKLVALNKSPDAPKVLEAGKAGAQLVAVAAKPGSQQLKQDIQQEATQVVSTIKQVAERSKNSPETQIAASTALTDVGATAVQTNNKQLENKVLSSLSQVGKAAADNTVPTKVYTSFKDIAKNASSEEQRNSILQAATSGVLEAATTADKTKNTEKLRWLPLNDAYVESTNLSKFYMAKGDTVRANLASKQAQAFQAYIAKARPNGPAPAPP